MISTCPRVVIAGVAGDSGKTLLSLGLLAHARQGGKRVAAFKKGPDFIDAAWLTAVAGNAARNLDTYLMSNDTVRQSFVQSTQNVDAAVIEGNRGLYDGVNSHGQFSTAALARLLEAPIILVLNARKATRTLAAVVLGCQTLEHDVNIAGVVLNHISGSRHEHTTESAIERECGIPVFGALPTLGDAVSLPSRHLGLVPPAEYGSIDELSTHIGDAVARHLDLAGILRVAAQARHIEVETRVDECPGADGQGLTIGYFSDATFTFYYPENLESLTRSGAKLAPVSSLVDRDLPRIDALYIGGGFPETHAAQLSANTALMNAVRMAADSGLPIYAECGGLIYLCRSLKIDGETCRMAGVFPVDLEFHRRPCGHGYTELTVDRPNAFFPVGAELKGHEFHYTSVMDDLPPCDTAFALSKGNGIAEGRDALIRNNVLASYTHLHAVGSPEWVNGMIEAAGRRKQKLNHSPSLESSARIA